MWFFKQKEHWSHLCLLGFSEKEILPLPQDFQSDTYNGEKWSAYVLFQSTVDKKNPLIRFEKWHFVKTKNRKGILILESSLDSKSFLGSVAIEFVEGGSAGFRKPILDGKYHFQWKDLSSSGFLMTKTSGVPAPQVFTPETSFFFQRDFLVNLKGKIKNWRHSEWFIWDTQETKSSLGEFEYCFLAKGGKVEIG